MISIFSVTILVFYNLFLFINLSYFSKTINLYDYPNNSRKIHAKPTPSIGGVFLLSNLFLLLIIDFYYEIFSFNFLFLFLFSGVIFFIAFIDDKFDMQPSKKFFLIGLVIFLFLFFNQDILISRVVFDFYYFHFENIFLKYFVSWLCIMLFLNAVNLYDGANGQLPVYIIFILTFFIYENIFFLLSILILINVIFFSYYNFKGRIFFGDNGSFLIGFLISYMIIANNLTPNYISGEKIFLLMFLPGMDMLRLFIERLINKKNPFTADNFHIHHLMIRKFSTKERITFNILFYFIPLLLSYYLNNLLILILLTLFYLIFIYKFLGHKLKK
jgi:UDP-GlcNAc:undecaprenyl-phosphate/decaprenyl-phosphate GlcNAc-1-phosphate transferase